MKKDRTIEHDNAFRLLMTRSLPLASAARRLFFVGVLACLSYSNIFAATTLFVDSAFYSKYPYIRFVGSDENNAISDDTFYAIAAKIGFAVTLSVVPLGGTLRIAVDGEGRQQREEYQKKTFFHIAIFD